MRTFLKWCEDKKIVLPVISEKQQRTSITGIYPDGYGTRDAAMTGSEENTIAASAPFWRAAKEKMGIKKKKKIVSPHADGSIPS